MARRTAAEAAATRAAIVEAARRRFGTDGFATSLDAIAADAGVTRGAVHHHFADKRALFTEVFRLMVDELDEAVRAAVAAAPPSARTRAAGRALFAYCRRPEYRRIALAEAPGVLGLEEWYRIDRGRGAATMRAGVQAMADAGRLPAERVEPATVLLYGALTEATLVVAGDLAGVTEDELLDTFERLLAGLASR
jgi:AcrR family transcriptional regulator